ncbi:disease resistance protein TAO1-like [Gossypium australe]|uniref:Disease resistance protein TAO1-like n=1 Tax=Gossypium australe TaxID=47621 RepID=A0A5B6WE24_9ROSI|nr:disease resistance protein TAO1-like [Gossypium australe]
MTCIQKSVSDVIFTRTMACESPKQAWDRLKKEFQGTERMRQQQLLNLRRDFENLKMKEEETVKQYSDRIMAIVNSIRLLGDYKEELANRRSIKNVPSKPRADLPRAPLATKGRKPSLISLEEMENKDRLKQNQPQQPRVEAQVAEEGSEQEEQVFAISCSAIKRKATKGWLIDSGCTNHMTPDATVFNNIDRSFKTRVKVGNGHFIKAENKGDVLIDTSTGIKLVSNVLFVPKIDRNLLSIAQLLEKGYSVVFKDKECMIIDLSGSKLMLGHANYKSLVQLTKRDLVENFTKSVEKDDFKAAAETESGCKLKTLMIDSGTEYTSTRLPTKALVQKTPFEAWFGFKPFLAHLRVFGCICYAHIPTVKRDKLAKKAQPDILDKNEPETAAEDLMTDQTEANQNDPEMDIDDELVRGTRPLAEIHARADVAIVEPTSLLNGFLEEEIYAEQPEGFKVTGEEDKVYKLKKALYGLKQALRAWYDRIDSYLASLGFKRSIMSQTQQGIFLSQKAFALKILNKFSMLNYKATSTPVAIGEKLSRQGDFEKVCESTYRSLIGCLLYLTATRPDVMYIKGTLSFGMKFTKVKNMKLFGYANSDWAGSLDDMKTTSRYLFTLGSAIFCWSSKKQNVVAQSTAEAEYVAAASAVNQAIWLRK